MTANFIPARYDLAQVLKLPNLRRLRERSVLTQVELAQKADLARSTLVMLEQQKSGARQSTIRKLANALGCLPKELFDDPVS